jgi:hypothetical protein
MAEPTFDFQKFFADSLQILVNPSEYFSKLKKSGGLGDPIIRAVLYGIAAGVINFLWGILKLQPAGGWFGGILGSGIGIAALIFTIIGSVILLFIGGIVVLILSAISGGSTDFEGSMMVAASTMIVLPLSALIGFASGFSFFMAILIPLLTSLYGIFLMYNGIVHTLNGKKATAKIVSLVLSAFPVLFFLGSLICVDKLKTMSKDTEKFMEQLPESNREMKEKIDRLKEMMKKMKDEERRESGK